VRVRPRIVAGAVAGDCYREVVAKLSSILTSLAGGILSSLLGGTKARDAASPRPAQAAGRGGGRAGQPGPHTGAVPTPAGRAVAPSPSGRAMDLAQERGRHGATATVQIEARAAGKLRIAYAPEPDGAPDPGEIVWTWVPYEENDGRGKDRPVLVIGRLDAQRVIGFALTSKPHNAERDYVSLGVGEWDRDRRPSWLDMGRILRVDEQGMRREGAVLDRERFGRVAEALGRRYGWPVQ